jgi:zinc transport system substrate-binding protein
MQMQIIRINNQRGIIMLKKIAIIAIISCLILTISSCTNENASLSNSSTKIRVVVSFNAMAEFAQAVGKDKVDIQTIIPDGTEPHDYEPTAMDLKGLSNAKVFIYNGLEMEKWVNKALQAVDNKNLIIVDASNGCIPISNINPELIKNDGQDDPHLWISLKGAEIEAKNIRDALIKSDPTNKTYFEKNYSDFYNLLEQLYNEYTSKLSVVKNKNFVIGHASFAYLCRDFGLKQNSIEDVFAEGVPSTKRFIELVNYCNQNDIKTIFVENMVSPKVSEILANEVGAKTVKIYTIESKEDKKDYINRMEYNLQAIYNSLK